MEAIIEKCGKHRVFLACYCFFAVLLLIEMVIIFNVYNTLNYKGHKFRVHEVSSNGVIMYDHDRNELTMTVEMHTSVNIARTHTIKYLTETIVYRYEFGEDATYTFSDGSTYTEPFIQVSYSYNGLYPDEPLDNVQKEEKRLAGRLADYFFDYTSIEIFVGLIILGLLLLMLAHGTFFYPENFWRLQTFLSVRGGEPTDFYIFMSKLSSVVLTVIIYIGLIFIVLII